MFLHLLAHALIETCKNLEYIISCWHTFLNWYYTGQPKVKLEVKVLSNKRQEITLYPSFICSTWRLVLDDKRFFSCMKLNIWSVYSHVFVCIVLCMTQTHAFTQLWSVNYSDGVTCCNLMWLVARKLQSCWFLAKNHLLFYSFITTSTITTGWLEFHLNSS